MHTIHKPPHTLQEARPLRVEPLTVHLAPSPSERGIWWDRYDSKARVPELVLQTSQPPLGCGGALLLHAAVMRLCTAGSQCFRGSGLQGFSVAHPSSAVQKRQQRFRMRMRGVCLGSPRGGRCRRGTEHKRHSAQGQRCGAPAVTPERQSLLFSRGRAHCSPQGGRAE